MIISGNRFLKWSPPSLGTDIPNWFKSNVDRMRKDYYSDLDQLTAARLSDVLPASLNFNIDFITGINNLFACLDSMNVEMKNNVPIRDEVTLIAAGSFARGNFIEGSDLDLYYLISGSERSREYLRMIKDIFEMANLRFDSDITPAYTAQDMQNSMKLNDDWHQNSVSPNNEITMDDVERFYMTDPFCLEGKIFGTFDASIIAGRIDRFTQFRKLCMKHNYEFRDELNRRTIGALKNNERSELNPMNFDIKNDRGLIFYFHSVIRMLQLLGFNQLNYFGPGFRHILFSLEKANVISKNDNMFLRDVISFYLLVRYGIVQASIKYNKHPTSYDTRFYPEFSDDICARLRISKDELADRLQDYSARLIRFSHMIEEKHFSVYL